STPTGTTTLAQVPAPDCVGSRRGHRENSAEDPERTMPISKDHYCRRLTSSSSRGEASNKPLKKGRCPIRGSRLPRTTDMDRIQLPSRGPPYRSRSQGRHP